MPQVLVTGATGFLGSAVVNQLMAQGISVRTTSRATRPASELPDYHPWHLASPDDPTPLLRNVRCVIHTAGLAHKFSATQTESDYDRLNHQGVKRLAEAALHCGVRHFVLVSSVAVYGTGHRRPPDESTECHPTSPYGCSKLAGEQKLLDAVQTSSLRATILRPVTLYGEGDPGNVGRLSRALETGTFCWIGSGNNRKCLLHRDDAARACVLAALSSPRAPAQIYNVSAPPVRMQDIVKGLADALGQRRPRMKVPPELARRTLQVAAAMWPLQHRAQAWLRTLDKWLGDDVYDGTRFVGDFQFHPEVPLREGLRRQVHAASRSKTTTIRRAA